MRTLESQDDVDGNSIVAFANLSEQIEALQHACDNPGYRVTQCYIRDTLNFKRRAEKCLDRHKASFSNDEPEPSSNSARRSARLAKAKSSSTKKSTIRKWTNIVGETSEEDTPKREPESSRTTRNMRARPLSPWVYLLPPQATLYSKLPVAVRRWGKKKKQRQQKEGCSDLDTSQTMTEVPVDGERDLAKFSHDFSGERLEAAMARKDQLLWYEPCWFFNEDILP